MAELDERVFAAVEAVAGALSAQVRTSLSISELQLLTTQAQMLLAMKSTHRSIRRLVDFEAEDLDLTVDALTLTRTQLERCFIALLLVDNPVRWHSRYRKNAWKAFAEKFFRDQRNVGHLDPYREHFGPSGKGVENLRAFARQMDVSEDEFQTLRAQVFHDKERDPRFKQWFIADMPTPGKCLGELTDPTWKKLAELLYPYYDNLSHFSHGGLVGVMQAAALRNDLAFGQGAFDKEQFWSRTVMETTLPKSYASIVFAVTVFGRSYLDDGAVHEAVSRAWRPYLCDGVPLGVAIWDTWASAMINQQ